MLLLDLKDLRAMINFLAESASDPSIEYGNVSKASVGAIQRRLLTLEQPRGAKLFGEPTLDLPDLMRYDNHGYGNITILAADKLRRAEQAVRKSSRRRVIDSRKKTGAFERPSAQQSIRDP